MPETRYHRIETYKSDAEGGGLISVEETPYVVSDEQLADEAEEKALAKADTLINAITNLAEAKVFLKRLCKRLILKGSL